MYYIFVQKFYSLQKYTFLWKVFPRECEFREKK